MSDNVQIMLIAECLPGSVAPLNEALDRFDISCVLITPPGWRPHMTGADEPGKNALPALDQVQCSSIIKLVQAFDTAVIVANDVATATTLGADGCHLDNLDGLNDVYVSARKHVGTGAIVGAMPGTSRHASMSLAEAGADYVGYVVGDEDGDIGLHMIAWWAEIFESPVVAFTNGGFSACERAISAGPPDFLAIPLLINQSTLHLTDIAGLIEERGQLPIAEKDAK